MTLKSIFGRQWVRVLGLTGAALAGYVFGITTDRATAQPVQPAPDRRVVAYIYGTVPVTRAELAEFLIARGGYEKVDLVVNKKIIEVEAAETGTSRSHALEVEAGPGRRPRGHGYHRKADFVKHVLPRSPTSRSTSGLEDVVKPPHPARQDVPRSG